MMTRRQFLKAAGIGGLSLMAPPLLWKNEVQASLPDTLNYVAPAVIPQVIHVFLYGGPSELAGNLTNIAEIAANSQNPYPSSLDPDNANNDITDNHFWGAAGGDLMEQLLASGDMSLYRTINRIKDDNKGHGRCIAQNLVGNLDLSKAGIATTLAAIIDKFNPFVNKQVDDLLLPFVTLEGNSRVFSPGDLDIPLALRPLALDANFNNPYARSRNNYLDANNATDNDQKLEDLAQIRSNLFPQFEKVNDALIKRAELADFIDSSFNSDKIMEDLPVDPGSGQKIQYPNSNFGNRLRAAVSLAIKNPESISISLGSGGLGGWDDHSDSLTRYPGRVQRLMEALQVATRHLALMEANNIVINVFGD
ncbi:MAG: twin-arginine translocation signal domain-containing protein, partial [Desulfobacterales bacterium]